MFNPAKTSNKDDILDILTYVRKMENEYGDLLFRDLQLFDVDTFDQEDQQFELLSTPF